MPEAHHVRTELQQVGRCGQVHDPGVQAAYLSRPEDQRRVANRIGRREQDQPLDLGWQPTKPRCVLIFDAPGQVSRVRKSEPAGARRIRGLGPRPGRATARRPRRTVSAASRRPQP
jgi:hypothetical protein